MAINVGNIDIEKSSSKTLYTEQNGKRKNLIWFKLTDSREDVYGNQLLSNALSLRGGIPLVSSKCIPKVTWNGRACSPYSTGLDGLSNFIRLFVLDKSTAHGQQVFRLVNCRRHGKIVDETKYEETIKKGTDKRLRFRFPIMHFNCTASCYKDYDIHLLFQIQLGNKYWESKPLKIKLHSPKKPKNNETSTKQTQQKRKRVETQIVVKEEVDEFDTKKLRTDVYHDVYARIYNVLEAIRIVENSLNIVYTKPQTRMRLLLTESDICKEVAARLNFFKPQLNVKEQQQILYAITQLNTAIYMHQVNNRSFDHVNDAIRALNSLDRDWRYESSMNELIASVFNTKGMIARANRNFKKSKFCFKYALARSNRNPIILSNLGFLYTEYGMLDLALHCHLKAKEYMGGMSSEEKVAILNGLAFCYFEKEDFNKALEIFIEALKYQSITKNTILLSNVGWLLVVMQFYKEAIDVCTLSMPNRYALYYRAIAKSHLNDIDGSLADLNEARKLFSEKHYNPYRVQIIDADKLEIMRCAHLGITPNIVPHLEDYTVPVQPTFDKDEAKRLVAKLLTFLNLKYTHEPSHQDVITLLLGDDLSTAIELPADNLLDQIASENSLYG